MLAETQTVCYLLVGVAATDALDDLFFAIRNAAYFGGVWGEGSVMQECLHSVIVDPYLALVDDIEGFFKETELGICRQYTMYLVRKKRCDDAFLFDARIDKEHLRCRIPCEKPMIDSIDINKDDVRYEAVGEGSAADHNIFVIVIGQQVINSFRYEVIA